jgi:hypothetical protein
MLLDRMVNLLSRGCVVPVVKYIKQCWLRGDTDISLIRYFVTEVNTYLHVLLVVVVVAAAVSECHQDGHICIPCHKDIVLP